MKNARHNTEIVIVETMNDRMPRGIISHGRDQGVRTPARKNTHDAIGRISR